MHQIYLSCKQEFEKKEKDPNKNKWKNFKKQWIKDQQRKSFISPTGYIIVNKLCDAAIEIFVYEGGAGAPENSNGRKAYILV